MPGQVRATIESDADRNNQSIAALQLFTPSRWRLTNRDAAELRAHPAWDELVYPMRAAVGLTHAESASVIAPPITITRRGLIIEGYAAWQAARAHSKARVSCLECDLTDDQALELLIARHRRSSHLNAFTRVVLALRLESSYQAALVQRLTTGATPTPSNLTKRVQQDVRSQVARLADVSTGNVTKVKQILARCIPEVHQALRRGTVTIHKAWLWREWFPERQRSALAAYEHRHDLSRVVRQLIAKQVREAGGGDANLRTRLKQLDLDDERLAVHVVDVPGLTLIVTRDAYEALVADRRA
jgi:hypothetical protein